MMTKVIRESRWVSPVLTIMLLTLLGCLLAVSMTVQGQDRTRLGEVWVTTQDYSALRAGPGTLWPKIAVIPYGVTLRATGRTLEGDWIQVAYHGEVEADAPPEVTIDGVTYGWIADWLLLWTGDILQLPVDGVPTLRSARRSGPLLEISPRYVYVDGIDPSTRVMDVQFDPETTEMTGRIGSPTGGYFWLQFRVGDEYYWTGTWDIGTPYSYTRLPDGAYIYAYGRLLLQLRLELSRAGGVYSIVSERWYSLAQGMNTTCNHIPADAVIAEDNFLPGDLSVESVYAPAVRALQAAIDETNQALALFRDVCSRLGEDRFAGDADVRTALGYLQEAQANFNFANTLLRPLQRRDPLLGNDGQAINQP